MATRGDLFRAALAANAAAARIGPEPGLRMANPQIGPSWDQSQPALPSKANKGKGDGINVLEGLLNVLTTPQAIVTSTLKELGDTMSNTDNQDASLGDWWNQIYHPKDRIYGQDLLFGNAQKGVQGASWAKALPDSPLLRIPLGLGADIATDPLSYALPASKLALGGPEAVAKEVLQSAGRQVADEALAAGAAHFGEEAVAKLMADAKGGGVGKLVEKIHEAAATAEPGSDLAKSSAKLRTLETAREEAVAGARRMGLQGMTDEQRAMFATREQTDLRLGQRGLRFAFTDKVIPGTDSAVAKRVGEAWAGTKAKGADAVASTLGKHFKTNQDVLLAARSGDPQKAYKAVATTMADQMLMAEHGSYALVWTNRLREATKELSSEEKSQLQDALETASRVTADGPDHLSGADVVGAQQKIIQEQLADPKFQPVKDLLDELLQVQQDAGLNIRQTLQYSPRELSAEGRQALQDLGLLRKDGNVGVLATHEKARSLVRGKWKLFDDNGEVIDWKLQAASPGKDWKWVADPTGQYNFGGQLFDAASQKEVRDKVDEIVKALLAKKDPQAAAEFTNLFNPDVVEVLSHYVNNAARRTAEANAATRLFNWGIGDSSRMLIKDPKAQRQVRKLLGLFGSSARESQKLQKAADLLAQGAADRGAVISSLAERMPPPVVDQIGTHTVAMADYADATARLKDALDGSRTLREGVSEADRMDEIHRALGDLIGTAHGIDDTAFRDGWADQYFRIDKNGDRVLRKGATEKAIADANKVMSQRTAELADVVRKTVNSSVSTVGALTGMESGTIPRALGSRRLRLAMEHVTGDSEQAAAMVGQTVEQIDQALNQYHNMDMLFTYLLGDTTERAGRRTVSTPRFDWLDRATRNTLETMRDAYGEAARWAEVQRVAADAGDQRLVRAAAYARTAEEAKAALADLHLDQFDMIKQIGELDQKTITVMTDAIKERAQVELRHGIGTPAEVADVLRRVERFEVKGVLRQFQKVVSWIAAWQIATPGFHNRNLLGIVINNSLRDVDLISYKEFWTARRAVMRMRAGEAIGRVSQEHIDRYLKLEKLIGEGQIGAFSHLAIGEEKSRNLLSKRGPIIRFSTKVGHDVEHLGRGTLGWDIMKKGGTEHDALHAINMFHFNYEDLTTTEQKLRTVVPFFTWSKNNLPLQIEMMARNPKVYTRTAFVTRNVNAQSSPDPVVPEYFSKLAPMMRLPWMTGGGHMYLTPDLPVRDLQLLEPGGRFQVGTPLRNAMSMVTPVIKTPIEMFGNKQFFKDIPLASDKYVPPPMPALMAKGLMPVLKASGVVHERDGQLLMSEKDAYALTQGIPLLGQYRRLFPNEPKYQRRAMSSWLSFIGIGMRSNTLDEQASVTTGNQIQEKVSASRQKHTDRQLQKAADLLNGKTS